MTDNIKDAHILIPELEHSIESIILNGKLIKALTTSISSPNLSNDIKEHLTIIRETTEEIIKEAAKYK